MCTIDQWRRTRLLMQKLVWYQLPGEHVADDVRLMRGKSRRVVRQPVLGNHGGGEVRKRSLRRRSPAGWRDGPDGCEERRRLSAVGRRGVLLVGLSWTTSTTSHVFNVSLRPTTSRIEHNHNSTLWRRVSSGWHENYINYSVEPRMGQAFTYWWPAPEVSPDEGFRREAETSINSMLFWLY